MCGRLAQSVVFALATAIVCPLTHSQLAAAVPTPETHNPRICLPSSPNDEKHASDPEIAITELTFEGDLHLPIADRDEIAASIKQRKYSGDFDGVISEVQERVRIGWQNRGYFQVQVSDSASTRVVTSSPVRQQIAVTVHVDDGLLYRLSEITFRNNRAVRNTKALRALFPIADGDIFDREKIAKGLESLRKAYGELAYINFTSLPDTRIDEASRTIALVIEADEGKQFVVSKVNVLGLDEHTKEQLLKDFPLKPGDLYNGRYLDLFLSRHHSLMSDDGSGDPRYLRQLDEETGTVAITFDLRTCIPVE
jgi:outer membrane protein insertion porin family